MKDPERKIKDTDWKIKDSNRKIKDPDRIQVRKHWYADQGYRYARH